jgi:hypothetical protein
MDSRCWIPFRSMMALFAVLLRSTHPLVPMAPPTFTLAEVPSH